MTREQLNTPDSVTRAIVLVGTLLHDVAGDVPTLLQRLRDQQGGFSANASGSATGGGSSDTTRPEAAVISPTIDTATMDLFRFTSALGRLLEAATIMRSIAGNYETMIGSARLASAPRDVYCANHEVIAQRLVYRAPDRVHCSFCAKVLRESKALPDFQLLKIHDNGQNLTPERYAAFVRRTRVEATKPKRKRKDQAA